MNTIGTIREFKTRNFRVIVDAIEDDAVDLSWDDTGEVLARLNSGEYTLFTARVRVFHKDLGELAADYLGGCIYESIDDFMDHTRCAAETRKLREKDSNATCGSYFADMIRTAITEARQSVARAKSIKLRAA